MEPITREEKLLDGQDLEPVTRKEMFIKRIYDKTQPIPEPLTREEMFLKKAGEGSGGDVTVEQLNVSANGTYSESGKAYSPVIVDVPSITTESLNVTENGTYNAPSGKAYDEVSVALPLGEKTITQNGEYNASSDSLKGFSKVTVNVSSGGENPLKGLLERTVSVIDDSVLESIGTNAFYNYTALSGNVNLTSIKFRNVTSIGRSSFYNCTALEEADFPNATSIGQGAFYNCTSLDTLILRKSDEFTSLANVSAFTNTPFASGGTGGTLYVPQALISSYQSASNWSTILGYANNQIKPIEGSIYE